MEAVLGLQFYISVFSLSYTSAEKSDLQPHDPLTLVLEKVPLGILGMIALITGMLLVSAGLKFRLKQHEIKDDL